MGSLLLVAAPLFLAVLLSAAPLPAQTLARPGWAGSGLNGEPWWRSAVFYRVDARTFQDSDGDAIGDLPGLTSRLEYLGTLGVDALILAPQAEAQTGTQASTLNLPAGSPAAHFVAGSGASRPSSSAGVPFALLDDPGFDDLVSEASHRHLRVVLSQPLSTDTPTLLARARLAFTRGAAGVELTSSGSTAAAGMAATSSDVLAALRTLAGGFPGERVVLSDLRPSNLPVTLRSARSGSSLRLHGSEALHASEAPELTALPVPLFTPIQPVASFEASASLRQLAAAAEALPAGIAPLFQAAEPAAGSPTRSEAHALTPSAIAFLAARLLTLRGALTLSAGQELGLPSTASGPMASGPMASGAAASGSTASSSPPLMQWTPRNITPPMVTIDPNPEPPPPTRSDVYGAYRPYVPVKPKPVLLPGAAPPPPDPDTLPGFTSAPLRFAPAPSLDTAHRNVAVENLDPRSVLNLYRQLIALHHGHATLRTGSTAVLDLPVPGATVWVRRAPSGARTVASVVMACNLSETPLSLSIDAELDRAHIRGGLLRPLLGNTTAASGPQSTAHLSLPPHSLYLGEIYHH